MRAKFLRISLLIYLGVYCVLSWNGRYVYANYGGADNRKTWHPAYCGCTYLAFSGRQGEALTPIGYFFLPLVLIDQLLIHPTDYNVDYAPIDDETRSGLSSQ